jgi:hypothetical protein
VGAGKSLRHKTYRKRVEMLKSRKITRSAARTVSAAFTFAQRICSPEKPTRLYHNSPSLTTQAKVIRFSLAFHLRPADNLIRVNSFNYPEG